MAGRIPAFTHLASAAKNVFDIVEVIMKCVNVASGLVCAALLGIASAHASVAPSTIGGDIAACHKRPLSERGVCKAEATRRFGALVAPMPTTSEGVSTAQAMPGSAAARAERDRYRALVTRCHRQPVSERDTCVDEASLRLAHPAQTG